MVEIGKLTTMGHPSQVYLLFRVFQHQILVFFKDEIIIFVIAMSNNK